MTMKIEAGKFYRTRGGQKVGPIKLAGQGNASLGFPFKDTDNQLWFTHEGIAESGLGGDRRPSSDIIAEWADLTTLTTPFGLLDRDTQEALKAHGGPHECYTGYEGWEDVAEPSWVSNAAYRVKPAPPKPRTIYLVECAPCGPAMVCHTAIEATKVALIHSGAKISEWAEVITE